MPDLRKDPIVDRWVIVAENRGERPHDFHPTVHGRNDRACPFCEGREEETPPEIAAVRDPGSTPDGKGWRVRVVPNKYPALQIEGTPQRSLEGGCEIIRGVGAHEVIIESAEHLKSTSELSVEQLRDVLWIYRSRLIDLGRDPRLAYGLIFKNVGPAAGASLEHTHSQLLATPILPTNIEQELTGSAAFYRRENQCVYCDMIGRELAGGKRLVLESRLFAAFCPFAGRFPYETWILPKSHCSHFERIEPDAAEDLADVLRRVVIRLETALDRPAYNYFLHTAPFDTPPLEHYHWHIEVMPSLTKAAGFEWGSGCHINPVAPETAAGLLRAAVKII